MLLILPLISCLGQTNEAFKLREFGRESCDYTQERLDVLLVALQENPTSKAYIISYDGYYKSRKNGKTVVIHSLSRAREDFFKKHIYMRRRYISGSDGKLLREDTDVKVDDPRIFYVKGGYRDEYSVELWLVPQHAAIPKPSPTVDPKDKKFKGLKIFRDSMLCEY